MRIGTKDEGPAFNNGSRKSKVKITRDASNLTMLFCLVQALLIQGGCAVAFLQVAESMSAIVGGMAFDLIGMSVRHVALLMSGIAAVSATLWVCYAAYQWPKGDIVRDDTGEEGKEEELLPRQRMSSASEVDESRV